MSKSLNDPPIESVLAASGGKFMAVTLAARRARQIWSYWTSDSLVDSPPPQVKLESTHPLSVAFDEISQEKVLPAPPNSEDIS
jgi:DNA-directed RNA polymerase subunit omega